MLKIQSCVYLLIDKFPMNPKLPKEVAWLLCHMLQTWEPTSCKGRLFTHIWNSSEADIVITIIVHIKKMVWKNSDTTCHRLALGYCKIKS